MKPAQRPKAWATGPCAGANSPAPCLMSGPGSGRGLWLAALWLALLAAPAAAAEDVRPPEETPAVTPPAVDYPLLQQKIRQGSASLGEVRLALTDTDVGSLTNAAHALYAMRADPAVRRLAEDLWALRKDAHPGLAWALLARAPVRLALASTLNRIKGGAATEQRAYIRAHKFDEHEFHRAQVVFALGVNGDPADIDYLKSMAGGENDYVAQSAISGLALMGGEAARDALAEIWLDARDTARGDLAKAMIQRVYNVTPALRKRGAETE